MIPPEVEDLARSFERIRRFTAFHPADRVWWLYLREGVQRWLEKNEDPALCSAHDGVKAFPENLPDEPARWRNLRTAVVDVLERYGPSLRS